MKEVTNYVFEVGDTFIGTEFSNWQEMYLDKNLEAVCSNLNIYVITDTGSLYDDMEMMGCGKSFNISNDYLTSLIVDGYLKHIGEVSL